ncbi:hypothetical protein [Pseudodesulfovibrio nedwellii]|nr:hypothetical protein [Pseudodesulfovibrio nedwellii]
MKQEQPVSGAATRLAPFPLAIAYVAVPLVAVLSVFMPSTRPVSPVLPWLLLAGVGVIYAMLFRRSGARLKKRFFFEVGMFITLVFIVVKNGQDLIHQLKIFVPVVVELTPVVMLVFCFLWIITFGLPDRADFQRYGGLLGLLCLIDLAVEASIYHSAPVTRWIGNIDILAGLLLLSLCASLRCGENDGGVYEPDQGRPVWRFLILLGIAATLSRTGLFAAGWIFLCFGRGSKTIRTVVLLAFLLLIGVTFLLPTTSSEAVRYVDYWLWAKSLSLFVSDPMLLLTGLPLTKALPLTFPPGMAGLWEAATGSLALMGAHLPQVSAFWLRLVLGWGMILPGLCLVVLFVLLYRRMSRLGAGLFVVLFTLGMVVPLLFDPSLGVATGLAFFLALSSPAPLPNVRTASVTDFSSGPAADHDPVVEWDMRPL